jgi:hypothetical protein
VRTRAERGHEAPQGFLVLAFVMKFALQFAIAGVP